MSFGKMIFYDWAGGNVLMFKAVNGGGGDAYNTLMILISRLTDYKNFPFYFVLLVFCAALDFGLRKIKGRGGANHCLIAWFGVLCVVLCAFAVDGAVVKLLKHTMEYPRPYVSLAPEDVSLLEYHIDRDDDYKSFPSGHVSFVTMLVAAVWPVISSGMRKFATFGVFMVCLSRIAVGMHFPADVFYAVLFSIVITFFVRWFIYRQLLRFNLKC